MENNMLTMIRIDDLHPHPDNPRKDLGDLSELTESIKKQGVMQNLTVVPDQDGYKVIIGHRRMAAAKAAGLEEVPCVIRELDDRKQFEIMMEENMQRQDLTVPEQAYGFQMMFNWGYSIKDIAEKTGFSETTVYHRLQIAKLDKKILQSRQQDRNDMLQLTISDLYELEKIAVVKDRNQILKEARDSKNLRYLVNEYVEKNKREDNKKKYIRILEEMGIQEAPDKVIKNRYSNKYEMLECFSLDKMPEKELKIKGLKKEMKAWYMPVSKYDRTIWIYGEVSKKDLPEKSEYDLKREKEEADRKKLKKIKQSIDKDRKTFIQGIIAGDYPDPKQSDIPAIWEMLTEAAIYLNTHLYQENIGEWITGKRGYNQSEEDKEKIAMTDLTNMEMLIVLTDYRADDAELVDWEGRYNTYGLAEGIELFHDVLSFWGFSVNDEEQIKVLNGEHELYRKSDKK